MRKLRFIPTHSGRHGNDRRSGLDRRRFTSVVPVDEDNERRAKDERRSVDERREDWVRVSEWHSSVIGIPVDELHQVKKRG